MSIKTKAKQYLWNNLVGFDQAFNTILGGDPDETISSRLGKIVISRPDSCKVCVFICSLLSKFEADHCLKAVERDRGRREVIK